MASIGNNAVQTLMSVNNIDQSVFIAQDKVTVNKYMGDFFQNLSSEGVYEAVVAMSGSSRTIHGTGEGGVNSKEVSTILFYCILMN